MLPSSGGKIVYFIAALEILCHLAISYFGGFLSHSSVKNPPAMQELQELKFKSLAGKIPWSWAWQSTPVFLRATIHRIAKSQT